MRDREVPMLDGLRQPTAERRSLPPRSPTTLRAIRPTELTHRPNQKHLRCDAVPRRSAIRLSPVPLASGPRGYNGGPPSRGNGFPNRGGYGGWVSMLPHPRNHNNYNQFPHPDELQGSIVQSVSAFSSLSSHSASSSTFLTARARSFD